MSSFEANALSRIADALEPRKRFIIEFVNEDELLDAVNGWRWRAAIEALDNWLRGLSKYDNKEMVSVQEVRERLATECPRE